MAKQALDLVLLHFPILALKAAEEEGEEEEEGEATNASNIIAGDESVRVE